MSVQLINDHPRFNPATEQSCRQTAEYLLTNTGYADHQYNILFTDDHAVQELNRNYRHIDKTTNVLSFPFEMEEDHELFIAHCKELGDIVISVDRAFAEAQEYSCTVQQRLNWLIVHGYLHLLGFDHDKSEQDAHIMYRKEQELLADLPV